MIGVLVKKKYVCNPSTCGYDCDKACKISEYLDIKNWSCKKHVLDKLVLACEYDILNTTKVTSVVYKEVTYEKNNCIIRTILLVILCFLLLNVIFISC